VHLVLGNAVDPRLGGGQAPEDRARPLLRRQREAAGLDQGQQVCQTSFRLGLVDDDADVGTLKGAAGLLTCLEPIAADRQARQRTAQRLQRQTGVEQRAEEHVAAGAGEAVEVGDAHGAILAEWR